MPDSKFVAHCAACGHTYRVPSDVKVYPCKECGGEVHADVEEQEVHMPKHRSIRDRHPRSKASKGPWIAVLIVAAIAGFGMLGSAQGWFGFLTGAESDFDEVTAQFVEHWNAGDLDALADMHHPSKSAEFRKTLELVRDHRGWAGGFPAVVEEQHGITDREGEVQSKAAIELRFDGIGLGGEDIAGWGSVMWQFEPARQRWYIFGMRLVPSPLEPRAREFAEAWGLSSTGELERFFKPTTKDKMVELVRKFGKKGGWLDRHPTIRATTVTGEEAVRQPSAGLLGGKGVFSEHTTTGKPLIAKWVFNSDLDQWVVIGFKSFP